MYQLFLKRFIDVATSLLIVLISAIPMLVIGGLIKLDSKGPVLFRQKRVGRKEVPFYIYKFRTMREVSDDAGICVTSDNDKRITKIGFHLRRTKLDEIPQVFNVILGHMSVVGPRPEVPQYVDCYDAESRKKIFQVRPGITDLASVFFRNESSLLAEAIDTEQAYIKEILPQKLRFYNSYVDQVSFSLDIKVIFLTVLVVIFPRSLGLFSEDTFL